MKKCTFFNQQSDDDENEEEERERERCVKRRGMSVKEMRKMKETSGGKEKLEEKMRSKKSESRSIQYKHTLETFREETRN